MTKIVAERPAGYQAVDMHHHSCASDGVADAVHIAKHLRARRAGVAITDHNTIQGSLRTCSERNIFSIPACEVTSISAKDILAYFPTSRRLKEFWKQEIKGHLKKDFFFNMNRTDLHSADIPERIHAHGGLAALPHPICSVPKTSKSFLRDIGYMKQIDMVESHNFVTGRYKATARLLRKVRKPHIAGSDSHTLSDASILTCARADSPADFLEEILKGRHLIYRGPDRPFRRTYEKLIVMMRNVRIFPKV